MSKKLRIAFLCLTSFLMLMNCSKGPGVYDKERRITVLVKDEDDNPIERATIKMKKTTKGEERSETWDTHKEGTITIQPIYLLPFELEISKGDEFILQTISVTVREFGNNRMSTEIPVTLIRRKTTILGRVVDRDTDKPVPLITVKVSPLSGLETLTNKEGRYRIESAAFYDGGEYTLSAEKWGKYEKGQQTVTITNYWAENPVPDISVKALEQDTVGVKAGDIYVPPITGEKAKTGE